MLCLLVMSSVQPLWAWDFGGHFKYTYNYIDYPDLSLATSLGGEQQISQGINTRLLLSGQRSNWDFDAIMI